MYKLIYFVIVAIFFIPQNVNANLSVSAPQIYFDANSPKRFDVLRVSNTSNTEKTYRLKFVNFKQLADGSYQTIEQSLPHAPFASPYIDFSPHTTTLKAGQSQAIRLVRKPMAGAQDGEYVSHLLIREVAENLKNTDQPSDNSLKINIRALYGVTIPVIIDKGNLTASASIATASVQKHSQDPIAAVTIKRSGTQSFWGNLIVKENQKEIGRINNFKIFLTTPERQIKVPLTQNPKEKIKIILEDARTNEVVSQKTI